MVTLVHILNLLITLAECVFASIHFPLAQLVRNLPAVQETSVRFLGQEEPWQRERVPTPVFLGYPGGSAGKQPTCKMETWVWKIPWRRESLPTPVLWPGEFHGLYTPWGRKQLDTTE